MARKNVKRKFSLPPLLPGSAYTIDDSDLCHAANLLGQAIAIVVHAENDKVSEACKKAWFELFEQERENVELYFKKRRNFYRRHPLHPGHLEPATDRENWYQMMIQRWLKKSLFETPDWDGLYKLADTQVLMFKEDHSDWWWDKVKSICRRAETTTRTFDPSAEIQKSGEKYRIREHQVEPPQQVLSEKQMGREKQEQATSLEINIPPEHRSAPLSLTRMAGYWGGDMTAKKLRSIIDEGHIKVHKINRQTFIFDTRLLPSNVIKKVKK